MRLLSQLKGVRPTSRFIFVILFFLVGLNGCSTVRKPAMKTSTTPPAVDVFKVVAIAQTKVGKNNKPCFDAVGTINRYKGTVDGILRDSVGRKFRVAGVAKNTQVAGGFAISVFTAANFKGSLNHDRGVGEWKDIFQCQGTWRATKVGSKPFLKPIKRHKI